MIFATVVVLLLLSFTIFMTKSGCSSNVSLGGLRALAWRAEARGCAQRATSRPMLPPAKGTKEPSKPSNALSASARVLKVTMAQQHCFLGVRPRA